jgi:signal transduction histidine kinase
LAQVILGNLSNYPLELKSVFERVIRGVLSVTNTDYCLSYLKSEELEVFTPYVWTGLTHTQQQIFFSQRLHPSTDLLAYKIFRLKAPLIHQSIDRAESPSILSSLKTRSALALPIIMRDSVLGIILAGSSSQKEFTQAQIQLAEAVASAAALAIDNIRLYQETNQRLQESQSLHQITLALVQKLQLEEVLEIVCSEAQRLTHANASSVSLVEEEHWLRMVYMTGGSNRSRARFSINDSLLGLAIRRSEAVLINNPPQSEEFTQADQPFSLLAVPLKIKGQIIGVLDIVTNPPGFSMEDVRLMQLYADQAAVAIEHARLYRQVEEMSILEERQRLARELHDSVNQSLYAVSLHTEVASRQLSQGNYEAVKSQLDTLRSTIKEALGEMRLLIFGLRPPVLDQKGLVEAIQLRLKSVEERTGLVIGFKSRVTSPLPEDVELNFYGIAQEALNNIIKHARASQVNLHLIQSGQSLVLKIEDNGIGFDPDKIGDAGVGLRAMHERAALLNARLVIQSQPGQGTSVMVEAKL